MAMMPPQSVRHGRCMDASLTTASNLSDIGLPSGGCAHSKAAHAVLTKKAPSSAMRHLDFGVGFGFDIISL